MHSGDISIESLKKYANMTKLNRIDNLTFFSFIKSNCITFDLDGKRKNWKINRKNWKFFSRLLKFIYTRLYYIGNDEMVKNLFGQYEDDRHETICKIKLTISKVNFILRILYFEEKKQLVVDIQCSLKNNKKPTTDQFLARNLSLLFNFCLSAFDSCNLFYDKIEFINENEVIFTFNNFNYTEEEAIIAEIKAIKLKETLKETVKVKNERQRL